MNTGFTEAWAEANNRKQRALAGKPKAEGAPMPAAVLAAEATYEREEAILWATYKREELILWTAVEEEMAKERGGTWASQKST